MPRLGTMLAASLVLLDVASAQDAPLLVDLAREWDVGTTFRVEMKKGRRTFRRGTIASDEHSTSRFVVEVVEAAPEGYVFRWTMRSIEFPPEFAADPLVTQVSRIMVGLPLDVRTDAYGAYVGLANEDEVRSGIQEFLLALRGALVEGGMDESTVDQAVTLVDESLTGDQMAAVVTKELALFHLPMGAELAVGESLSLEGGVPFPLAPSVIIPTKAELRLESADADEAVLKWTQIQDPDGLREAMRTLFESLGDPPPGAPDFDEFLDSMAMDVRDEGSFTVDRSDGLPTRARWTRRIDRSGTLERRVDWLEFRTTRQE